MKLVFEHGINDFDGTVTYMVDGKCKNKPFYKSWHSMLNRCYSSKYHQRQPTYISCSVCPEWLSLTVFKQWFDDNHIEGYQLDKDIIKKGNKIYCPEYYRYVSPQLNSLLNDCGSSRGDYPIGVCFHVGRKSKPYLASVNINGKSTYIGRYPTVKAAFTAYANAKHKLIIAAAREQTDQAIRDGLIAYAEHLLNQAESYVQR